MNALLIIIYLLLTIIVFIKKREYVLAVVLVGQPILKLMQKPFPNSINENITLIIYFFMGFFVLILLRLLKRKPIYFKTKSVSVKVLLFIIAFYFFMVISLIYTPDRNFGISKVAEFFSVPMLIVILTLLTINSKNKMYESMKAIANVSIFIGIITVIIVYMQTGDITVRVGSTDAREIRFLGVNFSVSIWYGRRMGIAFLAMFFVTLIKSNSMNKIKTLVLFILTILSISRGPIISLIITLLMIFLLNKDEVIIKSKRIKGIVVAVFIFLILIVIIGFTKGTGITDRLFTLSDSNSTGRIDMYLSSLNLIKDNLLGYGIGSFHHMYNGIHDYPHNVILEIIFELGIHTLMLFLLGILIILKYYFKKLNIIKKTVASPYYFFALSVFIFALLNAQFSGDLVSNEYIWFGIILLAKVIDSNSSAFNCDTKGKA